MKINLAATPVQFDEFFASGLEESISPFLTPQSRRWGKNLPLKASLVSVVLLIIAFALRLHPSTIPISPLPLLIVYFLAGIPSLIDAVHDILSLEINIDVLMTLAAFLSVLIGSEMEGGLLLVLFALSGSIEEAVSGKAKQALQSLHHLAPAIVCIIGKEGKVLERHIRDVEVGTLILVRAGEIIPLDGIVMEGASSINLVHLTGESVPVTKKTGDAVPAGGRTLEGTLTVKVTHTSADSTLAKIIKLITQAQEARPKFQRWVDALSRGYAITIICCSFAFALLLPLVTTLPFIGVEGSIYRALAFLITASPCALIIALPIAYLSAISACAKKGILLKGGVTLDAIASCTSIAFDKTGTLTTGDLKCVGYGPLSHEMDYDPDQALSIAAALERNAVHPIAKAIVATAAEKGIAPIKLENFRSIPGYGLEATALLKKGPQYVYIGNSDYIGPKLSKEISVSLQQKVEDARKEGLLVAVLFIDKSIILFRFQDTPRPNIKQTLVELRSSHKLRLLMLTGDHHANAEAISAEIGIDDFYADLKPEDKLEHVSRLAQKGGLAMIGDGINDAPALARATAGISMGQVGSRTAIDASDVVLLQDRLDLLSWLWKKSRQTRRIVKQNVILAFAAMILASIAALLGIVPLWLAVVLHEGGTVLVGFNSLRLLSRS